MSYPLIDSADFQLSAQLWWKMLLCPDKCALLSKMFKTHLNSQQHQMNMTTPAHHIRPFATPSPPPPPLLVLMQDTDLSLQHYPPLILRQDLPLKRCHFVPYQRKGQNHSKKKSHWTDHPPMFARER